MANANVPRGLIPYRRVDGQNWSAAGNIYFIPSGYAQNVFVGDPVISVHGSNDANGVPAINLATAGSSNPILGVVGGIVPGGDPQVAVTRDQPIYHPASTAQYVFVIDDPLALFMVQDDASAQATAPNQWASQNANLVAGSGGSTVTGYSSWQLQASSVATTATLQLRIIRPLPETDNTVSNVANGSPNAKWLVKINLHQMLTALGT